MADITDAPPAAVQTELDALSNMLDGDIPKKRRDNLLIATWNIRAFGGLTRKWAAASSDSPKRDLHALRIISEIVSRFDVVAIQEAKSDLTAVREMIRALGPAGWGMVITDVTWSNKGNDERLAFVYDRRRLEQDGLAAEIVVPTDGKRTESIPLATIEEQFARTPYAVGFKSKQASFVLVTLHILFGDAAADRVPEVESIAEMLSIWAKRKPKNVWDFDFIALGDFNINDRSGTLFKAFTKTGLKPAEDLKDAPRTIFKSSKNKYYDQIAWFHDSRGKSSLTFSASRGGHIDFKSVVYPGMSSSSLSWRVSDHYPLWVEFDTSGIG